MHHEIDERFFNHGISLFGGIYNQLTSNEKVDEINGVFLGIIIVSIYHKYMFNTAVLQKNYMIGSNRRETENIQKDFSKALQQKIFSRMEFR